MTAFWDIIPCSLVEVDQCFRGAYSLHHQGSSPILSETSIHFDETPRCYISEGYICGLHTYRRENLTSHSARRECLALGSSGKTILSQREEKKIGSP
jgi:hypothetical protein